MIRLPDLSSRGQASQAWINEQFYRAENLEHEAMRNSLNVTFIRNGV